MTKKELERKYEQGTPPDPRNLLGMRGATSEWSVRMWTGPLPDLGILRHRKRFWLCGDGVVRGCNVLFSDVLWGNFTVRRGGYVEHCTVIDYDDPRNVATRRVVDEIRTSGEPDLLVGRFCVVVGGRRRRVGYFTLRRLKACLSSSHTPSTQ